MYVIHPIWFYLFGFCESFKLFTMLVFALTFGAIIVILILNFISLVTDGEFDSEFVAKFTNSIFHKKSFIAIVILSGLLSFLTPSEKTLYLMLGSSVVTYENLEKTGETVKDFADYMIETIDTLIEEED